MKTCWQCSSQIPVTASVCPQCTRGVGIADVGAVLLVGGGNAFLFLLIVISMFIAMFRDCVK